MVAHYQITKGIPMPTFHSGMGRPSKFPIAHMEVGDSFTSPSYVNVTKLRTPKGSQFLCRQVIDPETGERYFRVWKVR